MPENNDFSEDIPFDPSFEEMQDTEEPDDTISDDESSQGVSDSGNSASNAAHRSFRVKERIKHGVMNFLQHPFRSIGRAIYNVGIFIASFAGDAVRAFATGNPSSYDREKVADNIKKKENIDNKDKNKNKDKSKEKDEKEKSKDEKSKSKDKSGRETTKEDFSESKDRTKEEFNKTVNENKEKAEAKVNTMNSIFKSLNTKIFLTVKDADIKNIAIQVARDNIPENKPRKVESLDKLKIGIPFMDKETKVIRNFKKMTDFAVANSVIQAIAKGWDKSEFGSGSKEKNKEENGIVNERDIIKPITIKLFPDKYKYLYTDASTYSVKDSEINDQINTVRINFYVGSEKKRTLIGSLSCDALDNDKLFNRSTIDALEANIKAAAKGKTVTPVIVKSPFENDIEQEQENSQEENKSTQRTESAQPSSNEEKQADKDSGSQQSDNTESRTKEEHSNNSRDTQNKDQNTEKEDLKNTEEVKESENNSESKENKSENAAERIKVKEDSVEISSNEDMIAFMKRAAKEITESMNTSEKEFKEKDEHNIDGSAVKNEAETKTEDEVFPEENDAAEEEVDDNEAEL